MQQVRKVRFFIARWVIIMILLSIVLTAGAAPVSADSVVSMQNYSIPLTISRMVYCAAGGAGEFVTFTGMLHIVFFSVENEQGDVVQKSQVNFQDMAGVGNTTGDIYRATGMSQGISTLVAGETYTNVNNINIVAQGKGSKFTTHWNFHITQNANGEITADVFNFHEECK
jgi:hypothetical protein